MYLPKKFLFLWITIFFVMNISDSIVAEEDDDIDLTFPNCGKKYVKLVEPARPVRKRSRKQVNSDFGDGVYGVIGGRDVETETGWPWMAAMFLLHSGGKQFFCGGTLISRLYVLTAAHCIFLGEETAQVSPSNLFIRVGSNLKNEGTEYGVSNVLPHPQYDHYELYNDIALIRLAKEAQLTPKVVPVCIPSKGGLGDRVREEGEAVLTGWGQTSIRSDSVSNVLQEVTIQIVPREECAKKYKTEEGDITEGQICAGQEGVETGACFGDSGGPMVTRLTDAGTYAQVGVVSFGRDCGAPFYFPEVYTRLSHYTKWLRDNTDLGSR